MATSKPKFVLSRSQDIPFNKLVLSQSNVRRIKAGLSVEELAEDIGRRGLLQSLNVRPVRDETGAETGMFEIPAGGRRYRALEILVKQKRITKTTPIPCVVREGSDTSAEEDSLAENVQRASLHPLDQFRSFKILLDQGLSEEEIAARFFVSPTVVKQRLRLAAVSDKLLSAYAEDEMTLEQLMAFTVTGDHARQEQVWSNFSESYSPDPYMIRRLLTEGAVAASDKRAQFIGGDAYEAAGGTIIRDLFDEDERGWLQDPGLLDRLVAEKLKAVAEDLSKEGWKWIAVAADFPYGHTNGLGYLHGRSQDLSDEEQTTRNALCAEFDKIEQEYQNTELPDEADLRLDQIETALEAIDNHPVIYEPDDIVRAGVFVSLDFGGNLRIERGFVKPEDEVPDSEGDVTDGSNETVAGSPSNPARQTIITIGGVPDDEAATEDGVRPLPDRLLTELTAHRTIALQDAVANNPHVAMTVLLHRLCRDTFFTSFDRGCLELKLERVEFPVQAADLKESTSAKSNGARHAAWAAQVPSDDQALWNWIAGLAEGKRAELLAHCISTGIDALHQKHDPHGGPSRRSVEHRLYQADRLAAALNLDMVEAGWRPTVENYLGRVTKLAILEAVREAKGEGTAQLIDHLKKSEMAKEAERLLDGSGWLPDVLHSHDASESVDSLPSDDGDDLPEFLAGDGEDAGSQASAAE